MNPLLDTRVYTTELPGGEAINIAANTAAESIFHNCDADGDIFMLTKERLSDIRESPSEQVTEHDRGNGIIEYPSLAW